MSNYPLMYRLGLTPWERYGPVAAAQLGRLLDREVNEHGKAPGRALDVGCGRGLLAPELAERGWETVGIDLVPAAIEAARSKDTAGITYHVVDVTELEAANLGMFDLFMDSGCFQGLDPQQRVAEGRGVTALAAPDATLLMLAFSPSRYKRLVEGVAQAEIEAALPEWDLVHVEDADTDRMGWPMNKTAPKWYRFRRST